MQMLMYNNQKSCQSQDTSVCHFHHHYMFLGLPPIKNLKYKKITIKKSTIN